jgi:hypothetical protein
MLIRSDESTEGLSKVLPTGGSTTYKTSIDASDWRASRNQHQERVAYWAEDRVTRANDNRKHPVHDFLFTYYSYRPAHLLRWSPGADVEIVGATEAELDWPLDYVQTTSGYVIPARTFPEHRQEYLRWAVEYLETTRDRTAAFNCFGLHEWAMVYKLDTPRHSQVPLRLTQDEISAFVESSELRCTHYDAYRFFTPQAAPRNRSLLSRHTTTEFDQPGCVHVTMDLYKYAHKISPWCPAELVADSFLLAVEARTLDMCASPYDLKDYGFEPVRIETLEGRAEYTRRQNDLRERAMPIRERLISVYRALIK